MVQEVDTQIDNDTYLIIVYGKDKDKVKATPYNIKEDKLSKNLLDTPLKSTIAKVALAGVTSPIAQNLASKALPSAVLGRINSSISDIMADGKISVGEVAEDFIGSCTNTLDNMATDLGFPTPSSLYTAIMPGGTGVISKDFTNMLSKVMNKENKSLEKKNNEAKIVVIKLRIVTSDNESLGVDVPTRKTESGFEIATALSNNNRTKSCEVMLTTNTRLGTNMYQVKKQLEELRASKEPFDVYVNDKDVLHQYQYKNCVFSNLDFGAEHKNAMKCSLSIVEIPEWNVEFVKLSGKGNTVSSSAKKGSGSVSNIKKGVAQAKSSVENKVKTSEKTSQSKAQPITGKPKEYAINQLRAGKTVDQAYQGIKNAGYSDITKAQVEALAKQQMGL